MNASESQMQEAAAVASAHGDTMPAPAPDRRSEAALVEPDLEFIRSLRKLAGTDFKKCIQCGTCSGTCSISPDIYSFPCKEMAWAAWGMKDRLIRDLDVWLCYQCNDCSTRCPRGARPGYVLSAIRQHCVQHYSAPKFLARWVNQPQCIPLLLGIPAALLALALYLKVPIENALGIVTEAGDRIVYAYSSVFPHWLLDSFFGFFSLLVLIVTIFGIVRFWKTMKEEAELNGRFERVKGIVPSIGATIVNILTHDKFAGCEKARSRYWSHSGVLFGFLALTLVTLWIITIPINPFIKGAFVYPFGFFSPWKLLANAGGIALLAGCLLMIRDRFKNGEEDGLGNYSDWSLITTLLAVVLTGFATEVLHYVRLEPHRHIVYFVHLVFVFALLMYLPYSKLAHVVYRTVALVFAEHTDRSGTAQSVDIEIEQNAEIVK